jgi:hypothetical protein
MNEIKPMAWKCVWIADGEGCDWEQYHDEDDPMPERWDDAPDEITPLYSQQAIASLRAEVAKLHLDWSNAYHDFVAWKARAERAEAELDGLRYSNGTNATCAAAFKAEAEALREDAERYRLLCKLIDDGDQGVDDAVGDAYALGAGALDLFLDEQLRMPSVNAPKCLDTAAQPPQDGL